MTRGEARSYVLAGSRELWPAQEARIADVLMGVLVSGRGTEGAGYTFSCGCQHGVDSWAMKYLMERWPKACYQLCVPSQPCDYTFVRRVQQWIKERRLPLATVYDMPRGTTYIQRDHRTVDWAVEAAAGGPAAVVLAWPLYPLDDPRSRRSGTLATLRYAERQHDLTCHAWPLCE